MVHHMSCSMRHDEFSVGQVIIPTAHKPHYFSKVRLGQLSDRLKLMKEMKSTHNKIVKPSLMKVFDKGVSKLTIKKHYKLR